jgi:hypothetical protein
MVAFEEVLPSKFYICFSFPVIQLLSSHSNLIAIENIILKMSLMSEFRKQSRFCSDLYCSTVTSKKWWPHELSIAPFQWKDF